MYQFLVAGNDCVLESLMKHRVSEILVGAITVAAPAMFFWMLFVISSLVYMLFTYISVLTLWGKYRLMDSTTIYPVLRTYPAFLETTCIKFKRLDKTLHSNSICRCQRLCNCWNVNSKISIYASVTEIDSC